MKYYFLFALGLILNYNRLVCQTQDSTLLQNKADSTVAKSEQILPIDTATTNESQDLNYQNPKKYTIAAINVVCSEYTDKNVVKLLSGLEVGNDIKIPGEEVAKAIKALLDEKLFEDIKISLEKTIGSDAFLRIEVTEKPRLSKYTFSKNVKKGDIEDIRTKLGLKSGKVLTDFALSHIERIVKLHFINQGFANTKVILTQTPDKSQKTPHNILNIEVINQRKVRIANINIFGNKSISAFKIRRVLTESKKFRWYTFWNNGKYLQENLEKDLSNIIYIYNNRGFRDAKILKDTVYFVSDNRVNIDITIDEGNIYYFGDIKWIGNTKYRSGQLDTLLNIKKGSVFNQELLKQKLEMNPNGIDISSLYMDDGYLFFQIMPQETNVVNDTINLNIQMYEGKQAYINKVIVAGNTKTNDKVIYREIRTRPGQLFRRADVIRTQRELSQLGFFNPEKIGIVPKPNPADGTVDITYSLEEKPSDQIELSGGWGGNMFVGTLGLTFTNFSIQRFFNKSAWCPVPSGDGQRISIRAQASGPSYQSFNFSFNEPWLGGKKPNLLTISTFHSRFYTTPNISQYINNSSGQEVINPQFGGMFITGASIGLGKRLKKPDDFFTLYTDVSYNYYELYNYSLNLLKSGFANDINFKINISRNSVDAPIFPKSGSNFTFLMQLTPPYSLVNGKDYTKILEADKNRFIEYQKYKITAEWFFPLTNKKAAEGQEARNLVLRTKVGLGILGYYNKRVGTSPFERYYMGGGGMSGMQNFVSREVIALRGYTDNSISSGVGDPICTRYIMELRYPISLNPQATLFALGFVEAGNTWSNYDKFNPFNVKRSAGLGLRVFLPMFGMLGLDYGWGFDNIPGNLSSGNGAGQLHFTLGATLGEM